MTQPRKRALERSKALNEHALAVDGEMYYL